MDVPVISPTTFTYDTNGNLTGDGVRTYEYGFDDRLKAINEGSKRSEFTYDGMSRRVRVVEKENNVIVSDRRYVWSGLELAEERDAAGTTVLKRYYAQGVSIFDAQASNYKSYYYTRDHIGSVREMLDENANLRARYDYSVWGERTKLEGDMESDFGFTGHFTHCVSHLVMAPYREYDAGLGRWLTRDPIEEQGGINLYEYVFSNPVNLWDVLGLQSEADCLKNFNSEMADIFTDKIGSLVKGNVISLGSLAVGGGVAGITTIITGGNLPAGLVVGGVVAGGGTLYGIWGTVNDFKDLEKRAVEAKRQYEACTGN